MSYSSGGRGFTKPAPGAQINWGHHLARSLNSFWLLNEGCGPSSANIADPRYPATLQSGALWIGGHRGTGIRLSGGSYLSIGSSINECLNSSFTIFVRVLFDSVANNSVFGNRMAAGGTRGRTIGFNIWSGARLSFVEEGVSIIINSPSELAGNVWYDILWTYHKPSTMHKMYINKVLVGTAVQAFGGDYTGENYLGDNDTNPMSGRYEHAAVWSRALSQDEAVWISDEPYSILIHPAWRGYAGSGGVAISGTAELLAPAPSLSSLGGEGGDRTATAGFSTPAAALSGTAGSTVTGTSAYAAPSPGIAGSGTTGITGGSAIKSKTGRNAPRIAAPAPTLAASGSTGFTGTAAFAAPVPTMAATAAEGVTGTSAFTTPNVYFDPGGIGAISVARKQNLALLGVG